MIALIRCWKEGIIGALLIAIGVLWLGKAMTERQNGKLKRELAAANQTIERTREDVRARTALAKAEDAANAARVERDQSQISQEVQSDYHKDLADLRRRYDALRLRAGTTQADPRGGRGAPLPGLPAAAGGADGAAGQDGLSAGPSGELGAGDALIASEQALRLKALQDWVRGQVGVER